MTNTARDFIIGVLTMTLVLVLTFLVGGKIISFEADPVGVIATGAFATEVETVGELLAEFAATGAR